MSPSPETAASSSAKNGLPSERSSTALTNESGGCVAEDAAELLGDVAGAERRQAQVLDALGAIELGEQPAHRIAALQTVGAVRRHQQHAG